MATPDDDKRWLVWKRSMTGPYPVIARGYIQKHDRQQGISIHEIPDDVPNDVSIETLIKMFPYGCKL